MKELVRTTNPILLTSLKAKLQGEGIDVFIFDNNISIMEGSIGAFPRRVMVDEADHARASRVLEELENGSYS